MQATEETGGDLTASTLDFAGLDWETPLRGGRKVACEDLADIYRRLLPQGGDLATSEARVHRLLFDLCGMALRPGDRGDIWAARIVLVEQGRSKIPQDYAAEQWGIVADVASRTDNPGLRARLADLVWSMDRRNRPMADLAVVAYCDVIAGRLDGLYDAYLSETAAVGFEDIAVATRALQISAATQKGRAPADRPRAEALRLYDAAKSARDFVVFREIARVALAFDLLGAEVIGAHAEAVANEPASEGHDMAVQSLWRFAAEAYRRAHRVDDARRCQLRAVDFTLARARTAPSGFVASHHLRTAIGEMRAIAGTHAARVELERELRDRQREAVGEFEGGGSRFDVTDVAQAAMSNFRGLSLSAALRDFAVVDRVKSIAVQEAEARRSLKDFPLSGLFGSRHLDTDGKIIADGPAGGLVDEPDAETLGAKIRANAALQRNMVASGVIGPVRAMIGFAFDITEQDLWPIVSLSPFVPPDHAALFALGFTRFFQGDLMSATHLLIPQIEPALRHLVRNAGEEPSLLQSDLIQEDRSLSVMLAQDRVSLDAILGTELTATVDQIFNLKPPGLRHALAHGLVDAASCSGSDAIYAVWFLFQLTCLPLVDAWPEAIAPNLRTAFIDPAEWSPGGASSHQESENEGAVS